MTDPVQSATPAAASQPGLAPPSAAHVARMLNEHGYPFHYAVLEQARHLANRQPGPLRSRWVFEVAELPVMVTGDSRIDFVLRHELKPAYLVGECKRVNPAYTDWCFFRAPPVRRAEVVPQFWIEAWRQHPHDPGSFLLEGVPRSDARGRDYNIAFPVKGNAQGDNGGEPKKAIEQTLTQVARHANGFAKLLCDRPSLVQWNAPAVFILPVIFTTARLWTSDVNLSSADLTTGHVDAKEVALTERDWIAFQYHTSQGLRPEHTPIETATDLSTYLVQEVLRTIFVANTSGIEAFLAHLGEVL